MSAANTGAVANNRAIASVRRMILSPQLQVADTSSTETFYRARIRPDRIDGDLAYELAESYFSWAAPAIAAKATPVSGPPGTAGTPPSPGRCEPVGRRRPAPG